MFQFKFHKTKKEKPKSDKDKASSQNSAQFCKLHAFGEAKPSPRPNLNKGVSLNMLIYAEHNH